MSENTERQTAHDIAPTPAGQQQELSDETLESVSGGIIGPDGCIPRPFPGRPPYQLPTTDPTF